MLCFLELQTFWWIAWTFLSQEFNDTFRKFVRDPNLETHDDKQIQDVKKKLKQIS